MSNVYVLILGMFIVTYLPRLLPFFLVSGKKLPSKLEEFLRYIPYTALGALIIPGFIDAIPGHKIVAAVGITIAFMLSFIKNSIVIPVLGSIGVCILLLSLGL